MGYIPSCSRLSEGDYSAGDAADFDLTSYNKYYKTLWPNVIPGIVLGSLAAVGFIISLLWCCRLWRSGRPAKKLGSGSNAEGAAADDEHNQQQFIAEGQFPSDTPPAPLIPQRTPSRGSRVLQLLILLLALGLIGVCGWGLAVSIQETDRTVTSFWEVVDEADGKVTVALGSLQLLSNQLTLLSQALDLLLQYIDSATTVLSGLGLSQSGIQMLASAPREAKLTLEGVRGQVADGTVLLREKGSETISGLRDDLYSITDDIEQRWRFIPIAVVFGVTILCAALCCVLVIWMGWAKTASCFTALLWLMVALLMLLGVGLLRGVYEVGQDTCAYVESFTLRYAEEHMSNAADRQKVTAALDYYYGARDIPNDQVAQVLVGAPTQLINETLQRADVQLMLSMMDPSGMDLVSRVGRAIGAPLQDISRVLNILVLVPALQATVSSLEQQLLRSSIQPLYFQAKQWVCCEVAGSAYDVWIAWTVAGCVGWTLCALCTIRVIAHTHSRVRVRSRPPGPFLPQPQPYYIPETRWDLIEVESSKKKKKNECVIM